MSEKRVYIFSNYFEAPWKNSVFKRTRRVAMDRREKKKIFFSIAEWIALPYLQVGFTVDWSAQERSRELMHPSGYDPLDSIKRGTGPVES